MWEKIFLEYGILGAMLAYFIWKDKNMFEMHKTTMQKIVDQLESMQKEQKELKKDVEEIRKFIK